MTAAARLRRLATIARAIALLPFVTGFAIGAGLIVGSPLIA